MSARTVLIGLSGATPSLIERLSGDGELPFLEECGSSGVHGSLTSEVPVSDAAAWTTIVTGCSAGRHGAADLFRRESRGGHRLRALNSRDVAAEPVWVEVQRAGLRSTILDWPLTLPPPRVEGHVIPGSWASARQLRFGCHPSDLPRKLEAAGLKLEGFLLDANAPDPVEKPAEAAAWVEAQTRREQHVLETLRWLMASEPSDISLVVLRSFGRIADWLQRHESLREPARAYFAAIGRAVAALEEAAGDGANFLFVSEPGSGSAPAAARLNAWLERRGDLAWSDAANSPLEFKVLDTDQLNRQAQRIDWTRTRAWAPLAGQGEIHILLRDAEHANGIGEEEYEGYRQELAADLVASGEAERVWTLEEIYGDGSRDVSPDLVVRAKPEGDAGGVFYSKGPIFRQGFATAPISLIDLAPLLCYSLNLPLRAEMQGSLPAQVIRQEQMRSFAVQVGGTPTPQAAERTLDPQAEAEVLRRLRALGYVD